jgi:pheromone shutdown protein TraB
MTKFRLRLSRYMSHTLLTVARKSRTVVAVVGERHLEGMKKNWKQPIEVGENSVIHVI